MREICECGKIICHCSEKKPTLADVLSKWEQDIILWLVKKYKKSINVGYTHSVHLEKVNNLIQRLEKG